MKRILIIDDDDLIHILFRKFLEPEGYEVIEAYNGSDGIRLFNERPADLVITDIIMPGSSGIEVIEKFRREYPEVAIFAMSAGLQSDSQDLLKMAGILGAKKILRKPVDKKTLIEAIKKELGE